MALAYVRVGHPRTAEVRTALLGCSAKRFPAAYADGGGAARYQVEKVVEVTAHVACRNQQRSLMKWCKGVAKKIDIS